MPTNDTLRIGFLGAGGIARERHLPNLAHIDGVEVRVVCNRTEASGKEIAAAFDIPEVATDWHQVVQRDDLDAIFIGTWPYMHREMSVAAMHAGKHVFCQARMAMNLDAAKSMAGGAQAHPELVTMICPPPHRMPWEPYIQDIIGKQALGEVREVRLLSLSGANLGRINWRERIEYSGNQALQVGIWAETINAWLGEYDTLYATTATPIPTKLDENGEAVTVDIPQIVLVQGRLANGAVISEHHSGISPHESVNCLTVIGSEGTLRVDAMRTIAFAKGGQPLEPIHVPEELLRDWQVEQDFIDAVRQARRGEPWHVSPDFEEGLAYMKKVEAIQLSAASGRAVRPAAL